MRGARERLRDMLDTIEQIERYTSKGRDVFESDELIQNWVVHHLQIIGEAARGLPQSVRECSTDIPWTKIVGMRHILVHSYFQIDTEIVWGVVERDLSGLKRSLQTLIDELDNDERGAYKRD